MQLAELPKLHLRTRNVAVFVASCAGWRFAWSGGAPGWRCWSLQTTNSPISEFRAAMLIAKGFVPSTIDYSHGREPSRPTDGSAWVEARPCASTSFANGRAGGDLSVWNCQAAAPQEVSPVRQRLISEPMRAPSASLISGPKTWTWLELPCA